MESNGIELRERLAFYKLCGKRDHDLVNGYSTMTLRDFIRICFILHSLDFLAFESELFDEYYGNFQEEYEAYLTEETDPGDLASEGDRWLLDFLLQIEDGEMAAATAKKFEIGEVEAK